MRRQESTASHSKKLGSTLCSFSNAAVVAHSASANRIEWLLRSSVPTDVSVDVGGTTFSLHKFPLASRSGRIRRLVTESKDYLPHIKLLIPGGPKAFELVANFCYGICFEITTTNVAALSCAAHYLEMTDEYYGEGSLMSQTETFLNKVILDFSNAIAILHTCENLIPMAEELGIVSRCINAVASMACSDSVFNTSGWINKAEPPWIEDLTVLSVGFFRRMVAAMAYRGFTQEEAGEAVMLYAQCHLNGLGVTEVVLSSGEQHKQKALLETIVDMLPYKKNAVTTSFLFSLLRLAMTLDASLNSRLEIEQRIGMQLEDATLDDLSFLSMSGTALDEDVVHRLAMMFFKQTRDEDSLTSYEFANKSSRIKVANLLENYLVRISDDPRLDFGKFNALAQVVPEEARVASDSLYRAIDAYLKVHPALAEGARKEICKVMDVRKLSEEARLHAAQNERLPVQVVLQVLHIEQLRLKAGMPASRADMNRIQHKYRGNAEPSQRETYANLYLENMDVARKKMRLKNLEKKHEDYTKMKNQVMHGLFRSFSKSFCKWNPFGSKQLAPRSDESCINKSGRRHSIT